MGAVPVMLKDWTPEDPVLLTREKWVRQNANGQDFWLMIIVDKVIVAKNIVTAIIIILWKSEQTGKVFVQPLKCYH